MIIKFIQREIVQKSKKSLYIGIVGIAVALLLLVVLVFRDRSILVSANGFQNLMQTEKAPKIVQADSKYLYFELDKQIYRVYKDVVDDEFLKNTKIVSKDDSRVFVYCFFFLILVSIIISILLRKKNINLSWNKTGTFQKNQNGDNAEIVPMQSEVGFDDVAGIYEAKEELFDIIDFLKNPKKYQDRNIAIPRGVLLVGPPGVGKTLVAKALAGEANVPFFYQSSTSFVQIYTGMGAKKIRELFSVAKRNAPAIVFIDEIDALGKARGANRSDEREATLNELLMQMDGFSENSGVIVIAATNRAEVLDEALLRSGRFDRKVFLELPNLEDRKKILLVHLRDKQYNFNIDEAARSCIGFSGAALASLVNEAAIFALKQSRETIEQKDIFAVRDKVFSGKKMHSHLDLNQRELIGIYQSAKALSACLLGLEYEKISLIGEFLILNDGNIVSQSYLKNKIRFYLSGMLGVIAVKNERFTLGENDLKIVESIVRDAEKYHIYFDLEKEQEQFLQEIIKHKQVILEISEKLLQNEVLSSQEIKEIAKF